MIVYDIDLIHPINGHKIKRKINIHNMEEFEDFLGSNDFLFFSYQLAFTDNDFVVDFDVMEYKGIYILKPVKEFQKEIVITNYGLHHDMKMSFNSYMYACLICASNWIGWELYEKDRPDNRIYFDLCSELKDQCSILSDKEVSLIYSAID